VTSLPLDPRIVGLDLIGSIQMRTKYDDLKQWLQSLMTIAKVEKLSDNTYVLTLETRPRESGDDQYVHWSSYTIDTARNVPVLIKSGGRLVKSGESVTEEQSTIEWSDYDSLLVPTRYEWTNLSDNSTQRLEFQWKTVPFPANALTFAAWIYL
jgi:hypothetical protein